MPLSIQDVYKSRILTGSCTIHYLDIKNKTRHSWIATQRGLDRPAFYLQIFSEESEEITMNLIEKNKEIPLIFELRFVL